MSPLSVLDFGPDLLRAVLRAHLEETLPRLDPSKISSEFAAGVLVKNANIPVMQLLQRKGTPLRADLFYTRLIEKASSCLIVFRTETATTCGFGVITNTPSTPRLCVCNPTPDTIVDWLMPRSETNPATLRLYFSALTTKTTELAQTGYLPPEHS